MDMFILDSPCEAVDGEGHWTRATVVDVHEDEGFMVSFEGWGTRFNRRVPLTEIRPRTEAVEGNVLLLNLIHFIS